MADKIRTYKDLRVYRQAFDSAMEIFQLTQNIPKEEKYSLVDQVRRSSRSVCTNIAEALKRRRYKKSFILRLNDAESEACETQVWLEFANSCGYLEKSKELYLDDRYEHVSRQLYIMIRDADRWTL
jgi:four helix bundle protein